MGEDERAGSRTGQAGDEAPAKRRLGRVSGYVLRGVLSVGALICAGLVVVGLGGMAAPLPDRGLAQPEPAAIATPAALPSVPAPAKSAPVPAQAPPAQQAPPPQEEAAAAAPPPPAPEQITPQTAFTAWAARLSPITGIPARALESYANAHAVLAAAQPNCGLTWVTLAGIARVESNHGQYQGRTLGEDGLPSSPIIGVPLNGAPEVRTIADTDRGILDGDPMWDRAVGPFQFIPSTWAKWRTDGDGDGFTEPQDIDDAAVSAARYLCAGGRSVASGEGWIQAIMSYNNSVEYAQQVYGASQQYAIAAQGQN